MTKFHEIDDNDARFEPLLATGASQSMWIPGVIDVEFREVLPPSFLNIMASAESGGHAVVTSENAELETFFRNNQLLRAQDTFPSPPEISLAQPQAHLTNLPLQERRRFVTYHFPQGHDVLAIAKELRKLVPIRRALPVPRLAPASTPINEPDISKQWYIPRCGVQDAWNKATGEGVVVADIDWGFDIDHQDLRQRVKLTFNSISETQDVTQSAESGLLAHGTAVLGLIGAGDNDLGMVGFAFRADLWAIQAGDNRATSTPEHWVKAIRFVCDQQSNFRKVIALEAQTSSLKNVEMNVKINEAIKAAIDSGVVVCVPAGNRPGGDAELDDLGQKIPATGSILVGATSFHPSENRRSFDSQRGPRITVFAPGDNNRDFTCSIGPDDAYRSRFGGTSGATAKVAGAVALMLEVNKDLDHETIRTILRDKGDAMADNATELGNIFLNVREAVAEAERLKDNP